MIKNSFKQMINCIDCINITNCMYCTHCTHCTHCDSCYECLNCDSCVNCIRCYKSNNLFDKANRAFNIQLTSFKYDEFILKLNYWQRNNLINSSIDELLCLISLI